MIRNLKALGLAAMAVLALSALASASALAANGRLTSTGNVTLTGTEIAGKVNALTAFGITVKCPGSTYLGHKLGTTTGFLTSGSENATITPKYKEPCESNVGPTTIDLKGCDYVIHLGETTGVADTYSATYDIICTAPNDITVTNWFSEAEHKEGKEACTLHVSEQSGLKGGTVVDNTDGTLTLNGPVKGINVVETKDNLHPLLCPAKEGASELDLSVLVKGDNEGGTNTTISLSHL